MQSDTDCYDLIVVGAGPSGLAAADIALVHDLSVLMIDSLPRAGGQFLRPPTSTKRGDGWMAGHLYRPARELLDRVNTQPKLIRRFSTTVVGFDGGDSESTGHTVLLHNDRGISRVHAPQVIVATGCFERPINFRGWTTPGVVSSGALQTLLKSHGRIPADEVVLVGSHPLNLIVAEQLLDSGVNVKAVIFAQAISDLFRLLASPGIFIHGAVELATMVRVIARLLMRGVPIRFSQAPVAVEANGDRVAAVLISRLDRFGSPIPSQQYRIETQTLAMCYGFQVASELCRQAGAAVHWSPDNGGWLVTTDELMRTNVPTLYATGEQTGQHGADAAILKGQLAAYGVLIDSGRIAYNRVRQRVKRLHKKLTSKRKFAEVLNTLAAPPAQLSKQRADEETVVCRCEDVTVGDILTAAQSLGDSYPDANFIKSLTRAGMGMCQGRMCYRNIVDLIERDSEPVDPVGFTVQFPISPVPMSDV